jgi:hypothetical protein
MSSLGYYVAVSLFVAMIANDFLLARRIRQAQELQRLPASDMEPARFAGSPLGLVLNVFRWRKLPVPTDLSDPDHFAIRLHYRVQQILTVGLVAIVAFALLQNLAG